MSENPFNKQRLESNLPRTITPDAPKTPEQSGTERVIKPIKVLKSSDGQLYVQYQWIEGGKTTGPGGEPQFYTLTLDRLKIMINNGVNVVLENDSTKNDSTPSDSYERLQLFLQKQEELARKRELDLLAASVATNPSEVTANTAVPQTGIEELAQNQLPLEEEAESELALFEKNLQDFLKLVKAYLEIADNNEEEYKNIVNSSIEIFKQLANDRLSNEFFKESNELAEKLLNSLLQLEERRLGQLGQTDYIYNFIFEFSVEIKNNSFGTSHFFVFVADRLLRINSEKYAPILESWFSQFNFPLDSLQVIKNGKLLEGVDFSFLFQDDLKSNLYFLFLETGYSMFGAVKDEAFKSVLDSFEMTWNEAIESASSIWWNDFASQLNTEITSDEAKLSSLHNEYWNAGNERSLEIDNEFQAIKQKYNNYLENPVNLYIRNINNAISSLEGFIKSSYTGVNFQVIHNIIDRLNNLLSAIKEIKERCTEITEKN